MIPINDSSLSHASSELGVAPSEMKASCLFASRARRARSRVRRRRASHGVVRSCSRGDIRYLSREISSLRFAASVTARDNAVGWGPVGKETTVQCPCRPGAVHGRQGSAEACDCAPLLAQAELDPELVTRSRVPVRSNCVSRATEDHSPHPPRRVRVGWARTSERAERRVGLARRDVTRARLAQCRQRSARESLR